MCISNELLCFEVKQNNRVELHTQALSAQSMHHRCMMTKLIMKSVTYDQAMGTVVHMSKMEGNCIELDEYW